MIKKIMSLSFKVAILLLSVGSISAMTERVPPLITGELADYYQALDDLVDCVLKNNFVLKQSEQEAIDPIARACQLDPGILMEHSYVFCNYIQLEDDWYRSIARCCREADFSVDGVIDEEAVGRLLAYLPLLKAKVIEAIPPSVA